MGTIVYSNLVDLLLEEGEKTKEDIVKESIERFGFPEEDLSINIEMDLILKKLNNYVLEGEDGKYCLLKLTDTEYIKRTAFVNCLNKASDKYFNTLPHIKKLKQ